MYAMDNIQSSENRKISHNQLVGNLYYIFEIENNKFCL